MIAAFPHHYKVELIRTEGSAAVLSAGLRPELAGGPPPEFGGQDGRWSPEHLLLASAELCLMSTYLALAEKSGLKVLSYQSRAKGTLDRTKEGIIFSDITIHAAVGVNDAERAKAEQLLQTAKSYCIISNALKTPITVHGVVTPVQDSHFVGLI